MKTQAQPIGHHIRLRLTHDRLILDHPDKRAIAARIVLQIGKEHDLLAFSIADTHAHLEAAGSRAEATELARRTEIALKLALRLPVSFQPAYLEPIWQQRHLYNAFRYILQQASHHGLDNDPFSDSTNLPDLLGLRVIGGHYSAANVRRWLPRFQRQDLLDLYGVRELRPVAYDSARDTPHILPATLAAAGLPDLQHRYGLRANEARRAVMEIVASHMSNPQLARLLATSERSVQRLRRRAPPAAFVCAIRLQLDLRRQLLERSAAA